MKGILMKNKKTLHSKLIDYALTLGWNKNGFRQAVKDKLSILPWSENYQECNLCEEKDECEHYNKDKRCYCNENLECFSDFHALPDCWRMRIEFPGDKIDGVTVEWNYPILVIEALEVIVTHDLNEYKIGEYSDLWWRMDSSERIFFRLYQMDRFGTISIVTLPMDDEKKYIDNFFTKVLII